MSHGEQTLSRVEDTSSRRGTYRLNSATVKRVLALLAKARHGWGTRAAERMAASEDEILKVRDWLYDQAEGHATLTVSALAELARECPPQIVERIKEELFESPACDSPAGVLAGIGRVSRVFGGLQIALDELLSDGRLDREEIPEVRRHLVQLLHEASGALQRIDGEKRS